MNGYKKAICTVSLCVLITFLCTSGVFARVSSENQHDPLEFDLEDYLENSVSVFSTSGWSDLPTPIPSAIQYAVARELMTGYADGTWRPGNNITRAEALTIFSRSYGATIPTYTNNPFNDINGHWAKNTILWAYNLGIVNGTSATTFSPDRYITNQDFCVMIYNYLDKAEKQTLPLEQPFTFIDDKEIAPYAKAKVYALVQAGIAGTALSK